MSLPLSAIVMCYQSDHDGNGSKDNILTVIMGYHYQLSGTIEVRSHTRIARWISFIQVTCILIYFTCFCRNQKKTSLNMKITCASTTVALAKLSLMKT